MLKMNAAQIARFWKYVCMDCVSDCWIWTGARCGYKRWYGLFFFSKAIRHALPHRVAYETWRGAIPDGLELDHRCDVKLCVNPWHVEPATTRVNTLRGHSLSARRARQTLCRYGHPLSGANLRVDNVPGRGFKRTCLTCVRWWQRAKRYKLAGFPPPPRPIAVDVAPKPRTPMRLRRP